MKKLLSLVVMLAVSGAAQNFPEFNPSKLPKPEKVITGTFRVETYKNGDGVLLLLINNEEAQMHAIPFTADQLNHLVVYHPCQGATVQWKSSPCK